MRRGACLLLFVLVACAGSAAARPDVSYHAESVTLRRASALRPRRALSRRLVRRRASRPPIDRKPEIDLSSPRQVHVTYAIPADAPDQFGTLAPRIATDMEAMDTWWRGQDGDTDAPLRPVRLPRLRDEVRRARHRLRPPAARRRASYLGDAGADRL